MGWTCKILSSDKSESFILDTNQAIQHLREKGLTYCGRPGKLEVLQQLVAFVESKQVPGIMLEAGGAMGGSASIIAKSKASGRELRLYDVFDLLPAPSAQDDEESHEAYQYFLSGKVEGLVDSNYVAHAPELMAFARATMMQVGVDVDNANIHFIKGLYEDTLHVEVPIAFAHIDCDWYESVVTCIQRIADRMSLGGVILFDDYNSFSGCRRAVDEWLPNDPRFKAIHADWTVAIQRVG